MLMSYAFRAVRKGSPNSDSGPDPHLQRFALLVDQRCTFFWRRQPLRFEHGRPTRQQVGFVQRPRLVKDAGAVEGVPASGIQDIPFGEEKPQGTRLGLRQPIADRPDGVESGGGSMGAGTPRSKAYGVASPFEAHARVEVGYVEGQPRP